MGRHGAPGACRGAAEMTGRVVAWLVLTVLLDLLTKRIPSDGLTTMGNPSVSACQVEFTEDRKSSPKKHAHAHLSLRTARSCGTLHANELAECVCVGG